MSAHDRNGEQLPIFEFSANGSSSQGRKALHEGKMPVCAVSEDAATLVLWRRAGLRYQEVGRQELDLFPGEVNLIRFEL